MVGHNIKGLKNYSNILFQDLPEEIEKCQFLYQELNLGLLKYETGVLSTQLQHSVTHFEDPNLKFCQKTCHRSFDISVKNDTAETNSANYTMLMVKFNLC
jgi:hypothetical protein